MSASELRDYANRLILTELDWYDKSPLVQALKPHAGRWIHFTSVRKLGVNPKKHHKDPHGVYFYPVDWVLTHNERVAEGQQYGFNLPYYFLCDLDLDQRGVVLSRVTWEQVTALAERNGWKEHLDAYHADPESFRLPYYVKKDMPGGILWHLVEKLVEQKVVTWNRAYAGLSYICDDNNSIIHNNEPSQIVVFDQKLIRNVEFHQNRRIVTWKNQDEYEHWSHALNTIIKTVSDRFGGTVTWIKKQPTAVFKVGVADFVLRLSEPKSWGLPGSIYLDFKHGRAKGQKWVSADGLKGQNTADIVARIEGWVEEIASYTTDLMFVPIIGEDEARNVLVDKILSPAMHFGFETEINNSSGKLSTLTVTAERSRRSDGIGVRTYAAVMAYSDRFSFHGGSQLYGPGASGDLGHQDLTNMFSFQSDYGREVTLENLDVELERSFAKMIKEFDERLQMYSPTAAYSYYHGKFYDRQDFQAFQGWVALNCGLSFGGQVEKHFSEQIEAYYAHREPDYLHREIADKFKKRN